jgi:GNAT superfamily N-acetyltransferase
MTLEEVKSVAVEWAAIEGWNPGLNDARVFYDTDTEGFFIGLLNGEPVACMSAVAYNADFGFIGFYIVKPEYRKEGYSIKLVSAAIDHLKTQNIGLDGVVEQQENYRKIGFKMAYNNIRFEGMSQKSDVKFPEISPASEVGFDEIAAYDTNLFPVPRLQFLKEWLNLPESNAFAFVQDGKLSGYGVIRKCRKGYKVGPLFADSEFIAGQLLITLIDSVEPGSQYYLDIPDINKEAVALTQEFNMEKVFETARMYSKSFPEIELGKIFGITSFELG